MILDQIIEASAGRARALPVSRTQVPRMATRSLDAAIRSGNRGRNSVIAEIKAASPSRGPIRSIPDPSGMAVELVSGGCCALSVITEPGFFSGHPGLIPQIRGSVDVPVLRKDFIVDGRQVRESRDLGADAVLLIAAVLGDRLGEFCDLAVKEGLEPLVEVHSRQEVRAALDTGASLIGINNRDLSTMKVDLSATRRIAPLIREAGRTVISESGFLWPCDLAGLKRYADGFLIGSSIMASKDPKKRLMGFVYA